MQINGYAFNAVPLNGSGDYRLQADAGAVVLAGVATGLYADRKMPSTGTSYALTRFDALTAVGRYIFGATGAYALTGYDAIIQKNIALRGGAGAFAVVGKPAILARSYLFTDLSRANFQMVKKGARLLKGYKTLPNARAFFMNGLDQNVYTGILERAFERTVNVPYENRAIAVQKEDRTINAGRPDSAIIVDIEDRLITVSEELV